MHWFLLQCCHKNLFGYLAFIKASECFFVTQVISFERELVSLMVTALDFNLQYQGQANWWLWFVNHTSTSPSGITRVGIWTICLLNIM